MWQLYDPTTESFTLLSGRMTQGRAQHTATLLLDGRVLIAGGEYQSAAAQLSTTWSAEVFSPATNRNIESPKFFKTSTPITVFSAVARSPSQARCNPPRCTTRRRGLINPSSGLRISMKTIPTTTIDITVGMKKAPRKKFEPRTPRSSRTARI